MTFKTVLIGVGQVEGAKELSAFRLELQLPFVPWKGLEIVVARGHYVNERQQVVPQQGGFTVDSVEYDVGTETFYCFNDDLDDAAFYEKAGFKRATIELVEKKPLEAYAIDSLHTWYLRPSTERLLEMQSQEEAERLKRMSRIE